MSLKIFSPEKNKVINIKTKHGDKVIKNYTEHMHNGDKHGNCAYSKILNPITGKFVSTYGKIGCNIIKSYNKNMYGGSYAPPPAAAPPPPPQRVVVSPSQPLRIVAPPPAHAAPPPPQREVASHATSEENRAKLERRKERKKRKKYNDIQKTCITIPADVSTSIFTSVPIGHVVGRGTFGEVIKTKSDEVEKIYYEVNYTNKMMSQLLESEKKEIGYLFIDNRWKDGDAEEMSVNKLIMTGNAISLDKFIIMIKHSSDCNKLLYQIILIVHHMVYTLYEHNLYYIDLKSKNILCQYLGDRRIRICFGDIGSCMPTKYIWDISKYKYMKQDYEWTPAYTIPHNITAEYQPYFEWVSTYGSMNHPNGITQSDQLAVSGNFHEYMKIELDSIFYLFMIVLLNNDNHVIRNGVFSTGITFYNEPHNRNNIWAQDKQTLIMNINKVLTDHGITDANEATLLNESGIAEIIGSIRPKSGVTQF
jgi:hypothetical protein